MPEPREDGAVVLPDHSTNKVHRSFRLSETAPRGHGQAIQEGLVIDAILIFFAALLLDGGQVLRMCLVLSLGHWLGCLLIVARRWSSPTQLDYLFIRFGGFLLMGIMFFFTAVVGR